MWALKYPDAQFRLLTSILFFNSMALTLTFVGVTRKTNFGQRTRQWQICIPPTHTPQIK